MWPLVEEAGSHGRSYREVLTLRDIKKWGASTTALIQTLQRPCSSFTILTVTVIKELYLCLAAFSYGQCFSKKQQSANITWKLTTETQLYLTSTSGKDILVKPFVKPSFLENHDPVSDLCLQLM